MYGGKPVEEDAGFEEVDDEAEGEVGGKVEAEFVAFVPTPRASAGVDQKDDDQREEGDFVELRGVAFDAVTIVIAPGERRGDAVGLIGESGEKAADAADDGADGEGYGKQVSGGAGDAEEFLSEFGGDEAAEQGSDDGLAAEGVEGEGEASGVFEGSEYAAAESGAEDGGSQDEPAVGPGERVAGAAALPPEELAADEVAQRFQNEVWGEGHGFVVWLSLALTFASSA